VLLCCLLLLLLIITDSPRNFRLADIATMERRVRSYPVQGSFDDGAEDFPDPFKNRADGEVEFSIISSKPPKPRSSATNQKYICPHEVSGSRKPSRSPTSVHEMLKRIAEEEGNDNYTPTPLREDYVLDKEGSDVTEVVSNIKNSINNGQGDGNRKPNMAATPFKQANMNSPKPFTFRSLKTQLFACGGPVSGVNAMRESIQEFNARMQQKGSNLKANVKKRGVETVEEVKGSFGDLNLTVRQVFSPIQNTKTGAGMVRDKVLDTVRSFKEKKEDDDIDDDDDATDSQKEDSYDDSYDDYSDSGSSLTYSESQYLNDGVSEVTEVSDCKEVTGW